MHVSWLCIESKGYHLWCPGFKKVIQSRDVTFNKSTMFSPRKESTVSSTRTGDHHDTSGKVELDVPAQGGVTTSTIPHSSSDVHIDEPNSSTSSPDERQVKDTYYIGRDRPRETIRKHARYATDDESGLIAYALAVEHALAVEQETLEGIEPSTYSKAIFGPNLAHGNARRNGELARKWNLGAM